MSKIALEFSMTLLLIYYIKNMTALSKFLTRAHPLAKTTLPLLGSFPARTFTQYRPKMQVNFGKENRFHLYHSEGGERFMTNCTRLNMLFLAGNSILLLLEIVSPCKTQGINPSSSSFWLLARCLSEHDFILLGHGFLDAAPLFDEDDLGPLRDA